MRPSGSQQLSLNLAPQVAIQYRMKEAVSLALRKSSLSRDQIADEIRERLAGVGLSIKISATTLDGWARLADTTHNIPAHIIPVLCQVTNNLEPLAVLAEALGLGLAGDRERYLMALGEAQIDSLRATRKRRAAIEALEDMR